MRTFSQCICIMIIGFAVCCLTFRVDKAPVIISDVKKKKEVETGIALQLTVKGLCVCVWWGGCTIHHLFPPGSLEFCIVNWYNRLKM